MKFTVQIEDSEVVVSRERPPTAIEQNGSEEAIMSVLECVSIAFSRDGHHPRIQSITTLIDDSRKD